MNSNIEVISKATPQIKFIITVILILFVLFQCYLPAFANIPQDDVSDIAISPQFGNDKTVYAIARSNVLKSTDGGFTWRRLVQGLDNTSQLNSIAIDPGSPSTIFLSSQSNGIYKSTDAGYSWKKTNLGIDSLNLTKLLVSRAQNNTVTFAVGAQGLLYKSANGGSSWAKVYNNTIPITAIAGFRWGYYIGREVLIGDKQGNLLLSKDGGLHWNKIFTFPSCGEITSIATSRNSSSLRNTFFVGTSLCGVFRTNDGGGTFHASNLGIPDFNIRSLAMSPMYDNDATVFASTWHQAMLISNNGGMSWQKYDKGLSTTPHADRIKQPDFGEIRISPNFKDDRIVFLGGFDGLFRSRTNGKQWNQKNTVPITLIQSFAISPTYNTDHTLVLTTYVSGLYKSKDDGKSWQKIAQNIATRNYDIDFSPAFSVDAKIFATINPNKIGLSTDRGESWISFPIPKNDLPTILAISPAFGNDKTLFVGTRLGRIYKSSNGGKSFSPVINQFFYECNECVSSLVVSPNYFYDKTVLAATKTGIHISHNGGSSWNLNKTKIFGDHIKFAFSPNYVTDRTIFIGGTKGLFRSMDGFKTWEKVTNVTRGVDGYVETIALSPNYKIDGTVIIVVKGKGPYKSENRGWTFHPIGTGLIKIQQSLALWDGFPAASSSTIKFSPTYAKDKIVFGTSSNRLFRSIDAGKSWETVVTHLDLGATVGIQ